MDPVTLMVAAVALGASDGARETTTQAIGDAYAAVKTWIARWYGSVTAEVEELEREPWEDLRRALLAKKLNQAGAGDDAELLGLAQALLEAVEEQAPELPATVGVVIRRASVGGDIAVEDVAVDGGSGVVAEDLEAGGDLRIGRVAARASQEPPHSPVARGAVDNSSASAHNFTSTQRNVIAGRDNNTYYSVGAAETGNSGGRIRAVTASAKPMPIGQGLWTVTVNNASSGPITDLKVEVYAVDQAGNRLDEDACQPAKGKISVEGLFGEILSSGMTGALGAIGSHANSMFPTGMGMPANLGSYGGAFSNYAMGAPGLSTLLQNAQQQMVDEYPQVISRDQSAEVLFSAPAAASVRVDLQFADDMGDLWRRRHGEQPEPVMEDE